MLRPGPLPGEFVNLRHLRAEDAELTLRWRQSSRAYLLNRGSQTIEQQAGWIISRPQSELNFVIELKNGSPVGMISLINIDFQHQRAEAARFLIGEEAAARGIPVAVEAMLLIYRVAFDEIKLQRVFGVVASGNSRMVKWHKYMGLREEGRLRRHFFMDHQYHDGILVGLLAEEFRQVTAPRMQGLLAAARR